LVEHPLNNIKENKMSKKRKHPYSKRRDGTYKETWTFWMKKRVVTIKQLIEFAMEELGKTFEQAHAIVTVILSPRLTSSRGDPRGSVSAAGHLYYAEKLPRKVIHGIRTPQKFRLCWREIALEPRKRLITEKVEAKKVIKSKDKVKVKASKKVKA